MYQLAGKMKFPARVGLALISTKYWDPPNAVVGGVAQVRRAHLAQADANVDPQWHVGQAIAAWILPGLGHFLLGERRRALILMISIGLLWSSGLLIGGAGVCDRQVRPYWYAGQVLVAPTLVVDYFQQRSRGQSGSSSARRATPRHGTSYGHMNEQGVLYTALAGLLNLLAVIDVIYRDPNRFKKALPGVAEVTGESS